MKVSYLKKILWLGLAMTLAMLCTACEKKPLSLDFNREKSTAQVKARTDNGTISYTADVGFNSRQQLVLIPRTHGEEVLISVVDLVKEKFYFVGKVRDGVEALELPLGEEMIQEMKQAYEDRTYFISEKGLKNFKASYEMYPLYFEDIKVTRDDASNALKEGETIYAVEAGNLRFMIYTKAENVHVDRQEVGELPLHVAEIQSYWRIIDGYYHSLEETSSRCSWQRMDQKTLEEIETHFDFEIFPTLHMEGPLEILASDVSMKNDLYLFTFQPDETSEVIEVSPSKFNALQLSKESYPFAMTYQKPLSSDTLWIQPLTYGDAFYHPLLGGKLTFAGERFIILEP